MGADIRRWRLDAAAILLCALAWLPAWAATRDLAWPCETDIYRDLGSAQALIDGNWGGDPGYQGETWWYGPLIPGLVALSAKLSGSPLHVAYTTHGVYLNLLAPLAFYALGAVA